MFEEKIAEMEKLGFRKAIATFYFDDGRKCSDVFWCKCLKNGAVDAWFPEMKDNILRAHKEAVSNVTFLE